MMALTPKQEAFAREYVATGNASEAYRRAYNAENMKQPSIAVEACNLLSEPNIALMVQQLKEDLLKRHRLTVDDLIEELEQARSAALNQEKPQAAAMVAASMGKAKLLGLEAPAKTEVTGANGLPIGVAILSPEAYKQARKDMMGDDDC